MDRAFAHAVCLSLAVFLVYPAFLAEAPAFTTQSLFSAPQPGQARAIRLVTQGNDAYDHGSFQGAIALYQEALNEDPLLAAAWINLAAARIARCEPGSARFAAYMGRLLDPKERKAARNLQESMRMSCPEEKPSPALTLETGILENPQDPDSWLGIAQLADERDEPLLQVYYLEQALLRGAPTENAVKAASLLEERGMLRAAAGLLKRHAVEEETQASLLAKLQNIGAIAHEVAERVSLAAGLTTPSEREDLSRLAEILLACTTDDSADAAEEQLERLLGIDQKRSIRGIWGTLLADPSWVAIDASKGKNPPLLVLRHFPGDLQLTIYSWPGVFDPENATERIESKLRAHLAAQSSAWKNCPFAEDGSSCHSAHFTIDLNAEGREEIEAFVFSGGEEPSSLAALALIGDGGCGDGCRSQAATQLTELLGTLTLGGTIEALPEPESWSVPTPRGWQASRAHSEAEDPWRSFALSGQKIVDLPPGLCVTSIGAHNRAFSGVPGASLWFRGRFEDREGIEVVVGDAQFAGWIEERREGQRAYLLAAIRNDPMILRPTTDSGARFVAMADLGPALSRAGARGVGVLLLFEGDTFGGKWLVIHREFGGQVVETFLPVAQGEASLSLPWIALTQRETDSAPPPPLVDHSQRHEIRFKRIDGHNARAEPREGILYAGEAELPVPRGFRVSMNATSESGFPVRLRSMATKSSFSLERWPASAGGTTKRRQQQAREGLGLTVSATWKRIKRTRRGQVWLAYFDDPAAVQPERCAILLIPDDPAAKAAFYISLERQEEVPRKDWIYRCKLLTGIRYRKSQR